MYLLVRVHISLIKQDDAREIMIIEEVFKEVKLTSGSRSPLRKTKVR
jgi:hypothetical protein